MKVQIRVCTNGQEIDEAKRKNDFYQTKRNENLKLPKGKKVTVPENVEVPEPAIVLSDLFLLMWSMCLSDGISPFNKDHISL